MFKTPHIFSFFFLWLNLVIYLNYSGIIPEFKKWNLQYLCNIKTVSNSTDLWISGLFLFLAASCSIPFFRYLVKRSFSVIAEDPKWCSARGLNKQCQNISASFVKSQSPPIPQLVKTQVQGSEAPWGWALTLLTNSSFNFQFRCFSEKTISLSESQIHQNTKF